MLSRADVIALAVAMGTPRGQAEQNYDAEFPAAPPPGAGDVVGSGLEVRPDGTRWQITAYGDGRREEIEVSDAAIAGAGVAGRSVRSVAKKR